MDAFEVLEEGADRFSRDLGPDRGIGDERTDIYALTDGAVRAVRQAPLLAEVHEEPGRCRTPKHLI